MDAYPLGIEPMGRGRGQRKENPRHRGIRRRTAAPWGFALLVGAILSSLGLASGSALGQQPPPAREADFNRWSGGGLKAELAPLTSEQAMAFFLGRGFTSALARRIVRAGCVFRSSIGNAGSEPGSPSVALDLERWRVDPGDGLRRLRLIQDWFAEWGPAEVSKPSRIALRWALFPVRQTFGPGDYNWGLFTFGLAPGTRFNLHMRWRLNGAEQQGTLAGMVCAEDNTE